MAHQGWDSLTIDLQHAMLDYRSMIPMLVGDLDHQHGAVVRVPCLEPGILMKTLDAGAYGVICPMANTRRRPESRRVDALRAAWQRSFGPVRALLYGAADYHEHATDTVVTLAMIKTSKALDNFDAILSVEGLEAIYIGPSDLSLALGCRPSAQHRYVRDTVLACIPPL